MENKHHRRLLLRERTDLEDLSVLVEGADRVESYMDIFTDILTNLVNLLN